MSRASEIRRHEVVVSASLALKQMVLIAVVCGLFSLRKESLGRPRRRWEDNIKNDLTELI